jgi:hypothetical protein
MGKKNKMPKKMYRLLIPTKDLATDSPGALTHAQIFSNGVIHYIFQPGRLDPKTGSPVRKYWITSDRVDPETEKVPLPNLPIEAFGIIHRDVVTGFTGKVIAFVMHPEGCVHAELQETDAAPLFSSLEARFSRTD